MDPMTPALLALGTIALVAGTFALLDFLSERKRKRHRPQ
jgi:hypothetical protein